jgi:hypothetical protein
MNATAEDLSVPTAVSSRMHVSRALYFRDFDFPKWIEPPARCELMIAATPRSGSSAFCLELWRTGVLGAPLEYANFGILEKIGRWMKRNGEMTEYWREVQSVRTGANGVFSYKFFISLESTDFEATFHRLSGAPDPGVAGIVPVPV